MTLRRLRNVDNLFAGVLNGVELEWKLPPDRGAEAGLLLEVVESENMLV